MARSVNKIKFSLKGIDEILEKINQLDVDVDSLVKEALREAMKPITATMEELVPVRSGKLKEGIQSTDVYEDGTAYKISGGVIFGEWPGPWSISEHPELFYAVFQEFGTINHPPQPFIGPAYEINKRKSHAIMKNVIKKGLGLK